MKGETKMNKELKVGDKVVVKVAKENREWGYNPCPDGVEGTITKFGEIAYGRVHNYGKKQGIYENKSWCDLKLDYGRVIHISTIHLDGKFSTMGGEFLRDLPETPFWEGDFVSCKEKEGTFQIISIDYNRIKETRDDGSPYPIYHISDNFTAGWYQAFSKEGLSLISRGDVWKLYNNEKLEFPDLKEEAEFFTRLGKTKEVRNPSNNLYSWTKDEVLKAIEDGIVHGFTMGGLFNSNRINTIWFEDEELGERVAKATLDGFSIA